MEEGEYPGYYPYTGRYDFEDLPLAGRSISGITIEAYTKYEYYDESNDLDTYMRRADEGGGSTWVGSLWGEEDWGWHTVRWTADLVNDALPDLTTQYGIDHARVRFIMYWTADDLEHGMVWIDAMRLRIDFSPIAPITPPYVILEPGQTMQMPCPLLHK